MKITAEYYHANTGQRVMTTVDNHNDLMRVNVEMGQSGYTPVVTPPQGGFRFGLAAEENFDWACLGGFKMMSAEGEEIVMWRGESYKKRTLDAVDTKKMKMPAAVKYSRGAKATDPEHTREKADGEFEYVTLAIFRGKSKVDPATQLSPEARQRQDDRLKAQLAK